MIDIKSTFVELADDKRFIQDVREIIQSRLMEQNTGDIFTIVPGIKGGQQVAAMKGIEYITRASQGCGGTSLSPQFPALLQQWNPRLCEIRLKYCYTDFMSHFTQWGLANGYDIKKLDEADFFTWIVDFIDQAMRLDMQRIALFGDKDIASQAILGDSSKAPFYNLIDKGLLPTLQFFKTREDMKENFVELSQNSAENQFSMEKNYAEELYEKVLDIDDFDTNILLSSNKLYKNYKRYIKKGVSDGLESNKVDIQKGVQNLSVDGEKIIPIKHYDRWRKNDFSKEGVVHLPHFALATKKEFLQIGVDSEAALSDLRFEYIGGDDEHFYIKGNYMMDFKMTNPFEFKASL